MPKPDALNRDFPQVLKESYDPAIERIRVDALITDGVDALIVNPDGSINVTVPAGSIVTSPNLHDGFGNPISSSADGSNRVLHTETPDAVSSTVTLGALNDMVTIPVQGLTSVGFQINPGTLIGSIKAQSSVDGGSTWVDVPFYEVSSSSVSSQINFGSPNTLKILSIVPVGGSSDIRVLVNSYTSGSATALLRASSITGTAPVILPAAGSALGVVESGTVDTAYNEVTSVATGVLTTVVTYSAVQNTRLKVCEFSGTNIATYTILVNGTPINKKNTYYGILDGKFDFSKGYNLISGDLVTVTAIHNRPDPGDFNAFILVLKD